jgi:hypothetical protein
VSKSRQYIHEQRNSDKEDGMKDLLYFDQMVTPKIITVVYWLLLVLLVISGLTTMFSGYGGATFGKFLTGLVVIIAGAIGIRIWCELTIVLFKIHENISNFRLGFCM